MQHPAEWTTALCAALVAVSAVDRQRIAGGSNKLAAIRHVKVTTAFRQYRGVIDWEFRRANDSCAQQFLRQSRKI